MADLWSDPDEIYKKLFPDVSEQDDDDYETRTKPYEKRVDDRDGGGLVFDGPDVWSSEDDDSDRSHLFSDDDNDDNDEDDDEEKNGKFVAFFQDSHKSVPGKEKGYTDGWGLFGDDEFSWSRQIVADNLRRRKLLAAGKRRLGGLPIGAHRHLAFFGSSPSTSFSDRRKNGKNGKNGKSEKEKKKVTKKPEQQQQQRKKSRKKSQDFSIDERRISRLSPSPERRPIALSSYLSFSPEPTKKGQKPLSLLFHDETRPLQGDRKNQGEHQHQRGKRLRTDAQLKSFAKKGYIPPLGKIHRQRQSEVIGEKTKKPLANDDDQKKAWTEKPVRRHMLDETSFDTFSFDPDPAVIVRREQNNFSGNRENKKNLSSLSEESIIAALVAASAKTTESQIALASNLLGNFEGSFGKLKKEEKKEKGEEEKKEKKENWNDTLNGRFIIVTNPQHDLFLPGRSISSNAKSVDEGQPSESELMMQECWQKRKRGPHWSDAASCSAVYGLSSVGHTFVLEPALEPTELIRTRSRSSSASSASSAVAASAAATAASAAVPSPPSSFFSPFSSRTTASSAPGSPQGSQLFDDLFLANQKKTGSTTLLVKPGTRSFSKRNDFFPDPWGTDSVSKNPKRLVDPSDVLGFGDEKREGGALAKKPENWKKREKREKREKDQDEIRPLATDIKVLFKDPLDNEETTLFLKDLKKERAWDDGKSDSCDCLVVDMRIADIALEDENNQVLWHGSIHELVDLRKNGFGVAELLDWAGRRLEAPLAPEKLMQLLDLLKKWREQMALAVSEQMGRPFVVLEPVAPVTKNPLFSVPSLPSLSKALRPSPLSSPRGPSSVPNSLDDLIKNALDTKKASSDLSRYDLFRESNRHAPHLVSGLAFDRDTKVTSARKRFIAGPLARFQWTSPVEWVSDIATFRLADVFSSPFSFLDQ